MFNCFEQLRNFNNYSNSCLLELVRGRISRRELFKEKPKVNSNIALNYYDGGLVPIPLEGKKALVKWGDFHDTKPSREQVQQWFQQFPDSRIGIITGQVSNLLVLDVDGEEGINQIKDKEVPTTWTVKTPRGGYHYYFNFPEILKDSKTTLAGILPNVDIRGYAGYVVSVNGHKDYSWVVHPADCDIAEVPQWLIDLILNKDKPTTATTTDAQDNGWISTLLQGVPEKGGPCGGRHGALVKLASYYFSRLPIDVASQLIRDWNDKNTPPLNEDELEDQIEDLANRFKSGEYTSNAPEELTAEDEETWSIAEVLEDVPEPEWIVENYIPKSGMVLLCGEAEKGKTWVALDLAIELTRGGKWLGQFATTKSKVLYIDEEKPKAFFKKRLRLLSNGKNYLAPKGSLSFSFQKGMKLDRDRGIKLFISLLEKHQPDVVILDAFADFLTGKENDVTDILKIYDLLKMMRKKYNTTFIVIDHEKQAMMDRQGQVIINEDYVGNDVRGSKSKRNVVDTQLSFKSVDGQIKVFHSKTSWTIRQKPFIISIDDIIKGESTKIEFKGFV
jgi:hypothetical protein